MLRYIFSNYSTNSNYSRSSSYSNNVEDSETITVLFAIDLWLLFIQPWTAKRPSAVPNSSKIYTVADKTFNIEEWRPFVASNLYFYTTVLACYLKMVARIHITSSPRHLSYLKKVLTVFAESNYRLLNMVDDLNAKFSNWYRPRGDRTRRRSLTADNGEYRSPVDHNRSTRFEDSNGKSRSPRSPRSPRAIPPLPLGTVFSVDGVVCLMALQHQSLFSDRSMDRLLIDSGICDLRQYTLESCVQLVYALQASKANILGIDRHALSVGEPSVLDWLINSVDNVTDYLSRLVGLYEPPISPEGVARDLTPKELQHNVASIESCISMLLIISPDADHGISSSVNSSLDSRMGLQKKELERQQQRSKQEAEEAERQRYVRDISSGRLTEYGKLQVLHGKEKLHINDPSSLVYQRRVPFFHYTDPMDLPVCSYESAVLVKWLVLLSKSLNQRFLLPRDDRWLLWQWGHLLELGRENDYRVGEEDVGVGVWRKREVSMAFVAYPLLCLFLLTVSRSIMWCESYSMLWKIGVCSLLMAPIVLSLMELYRNGFDSIEKKEFIRKLPSVTVTFLNSGFLNSIFRINLRVFATVRVAAVLGACCSLGLYASSIVNSATFLCLLAICVLFTAK
jgi:hypothetical protein